jgi:hypothetical protein
MAISYVFYVVVNTILNLVSFSVQRFSHVFLNLNYLQDWIIINLLYQNIFMTQAVYAAYLIINDALP